MRPSRAMTAEIVRVQGLHEGYRASGPEAVGGIDFSVARGELFGLLGPNGAGKTTTIGAITTRVRPTRGRVLVDDIDVSADPVAVKLRIAVVPQLSNLDRSLTAAAMGLVLGCAVPPNRISIAFAVVLTPLIFTGAGFYPWRALGHLRWFQIVTLANPLTYVSEGLRASLTAVPHLATGAITVGLAVALIGFGGLGTLLFVRRAVD